MPMRYLYTILCYLATPLVLIRLLWRSARDPRYRHRWRERFGHITPVESYDTLWFHAVSLGESIAATPLIRAILKQFPKYSLVVTTTTPTGSAYLQKTFGDQIHHFYMPYDLPHVLERFLIHIHPTKVIIMETELWPNLLHKLAYANTPTIIVNARLSERSFSQYSRFANFFRPLLSELIVSAQSDIDAKRFRELGVSHKRTIVTGNMKFDNPVADELIAKAKILSQHWQGRPTLIAGSTHEGEETLILDAFEKIREKYPNALLVLVPRHPERFDKVADLCIKSGYPIARRSEKQLPADTTPIYLGDTTGELTLLYAACEVAFVGGSFVPVGGHNLIEPASLSLPILSGPQLHNFIAVRDLLLDADALIIVDNAEQLANKVSMLFADRAIRDQYGARALGISEKNRGAVETNLKLISINL